MIGAARVVQRMTGLHGFFQGLSARVLYQAPSTAVAWSIYEFFKAILKEKQEEEGPAKKYDTLSDLRPLPQVQVLAAEVSKEGQ